MAEGLLLPLFLLTGSRVSASQVEGGNAVSEAVPEDSLPFEPAPIAETSPQGEFREGTNLDPALLIKSLEREAIDFPWQRRLNEFTIRDNDSFGRPVVFQLCDVRALVVAMKIKEVSRNV